MTRAVGLGLALVVVAWGSPAAAQPLGGALLANSYTVGLQSAPALAVDPAGNFVVVWESFNQDGDDIGVFGQRYSSAGARQGAEFQVNDFVSGPQEAPAVAVGADGGFVVVWQGYGDGGDYQDVLARRFDSNGAPVGGDFQVNTAPGLLEGAAAISALGSGFVIVWDDYDDVFARRYDGAGMPLGGEFQVNVTTLGFQGSADVAATADGGFVVAWEDGDFLDAGSDGAGYGIFARRFDGGGTPLGGEFQVNAGTVGDQYGVALAPAAGGGFVVVWQSYGHAGADSAVVGRRFDALGQPTAGDFRVNGSPAEYAVTPDVGADQAGNFVVVWGETPVDLGAVTTVLGRRYDANGNALEGPTAVNNSAATTQQYPVVGAAPDGRHTVAWRRDGGDASGEADVYAQRFAAIVIVPTATVTSTATRTGTRTATPTPTRSLPPTATTTRTPTRTRSATMTSTSTRTPTAGATPTFTAPPPSTSTPTPTPTAPNSPTPTCSATSIPTLTHTFAPSATLASTPTRTATPSPSAPSTPTATRSGTPTPTASATLTASPSSSAPPSATASPPPTATASPTSSAPATATAVPTLTRTATQTPTASALTIRPTEAPPASATASATAPPSLTATAPASHTLTAVPSPTMSPSAAPSPPDPSATAPPETPTAPPSPTVSAPPAACAGDCNGNRRVTVSELIMAVAAALGARAPDDCPAVDANADLGVSVNELVRAVGAALHGCA